jgi:hypothetical protein
MLNKKTVGLQGVSRGGSDRTIRASIDQSGIAKSSLNPRQVDPSRKGGESAVRTKTAQIIRRSFLPVLFPIARDATDSQTSAFIERKTRKVCCPKTCSASRLQVPENIRAHYRVAARPKTDVFDLENCPGVAGSFAAGLVLTECIRQAASLGDEQLRNTASDLDCNTFYGRFRIDSRTGIQTGHRVLLIRWQGDHKVVLPSRSK